MFLPENVKRIIELLSSSLFKAYAVGGCVRDAIMGREVSDYDITTSAQPQEVEKVLSENGIKYIETGLKHGTITALIEHTPYEITTFRTDGKYSDNRHPESVQFVNDIKDDLSRRDFTINAIAYNDADGFIDLFGGKEDIENKIIRTVGNSNKRFNEDALRIMRALRFSSQLGFTIEENTEKAIFDNKELLKNIAYERIFTELKKLILGDNASIVLTKYFEIIKVVIPELSETCFDSISFAPKSDYIRLAILLSETEGVSEVLKRLRVSNEVFDKVTKLIEYKNAEMADSVCIKKLLNALGEDLFFDLIEYKKAICLSQKEDVSKLESAALEAGRIIQSNEPFRIQDLDINGFDLMKLGFEGKEISEVLEKLLAEVIVNPEKNKKDILLNLAKKL